MPTPKVIRERPILMSAPMVRALLDGRKTQTRRIVKPQPELAESYSHQYPPDGPRTSYGFSGWYPSELHRRAKHYGSYDHLRRGLPEDFCPYGKPGDRLWVRETWRVHRDYDGLRAAGIYAAMGGDVAYCIRYENDGRSEEGWEGRRRVSRFMPRWASRITLEITEVRVQRLQEISEEDAIAEGSQIPLAQLPKSARQAAFSERQAYSRIWESINGAGSWDANPWVWALTFKRVK